jgi:hypothetical protein
VAAKRKYSGQQILASKINYKSAYQRGTLNFATALQTVTYLPKGKLAILTLCLTFCSAPCPFEWGVISETVCDLGNELLKCDNWEPLTLHALVQKEIPTQVYLDDGIPFAIGIVDIPINNWGYADIYISNTTGLTIDLPGTKNAVRLKTAIPLAFEVAAQPNNENEPIPCKPMVAREKLKAEGGLAETKMFLGWHFNFRTLVITLPEHKHITWSAKIKKMIDNDRTSKKSLELRIGCLGYISFVMPWDFHFLS